MTTLSGHMYGRVIELLAKVPGNYLEIGVFDGDGVASVAKHFTNKTIYAVDPFIEDGHTTASSGQVRGDVMTKQRSNCMNNIKNLQNVILHDVTSEQFERQLTTQDVDKMNISVVTIDGDHHYETVVIDTELALRLLGSRHGYIVFDDCDVAGVSKAYNEFAERYANRIVNKIPGPGAVHTLEIQAI